jgi:DNA-binding response OmpR family regulator
MGKPFSHLALMARIKAALRRAELRVPVQALPDFEASDITWSDSEGKRSSFTEPKRRVDISVQDKGVRRHSE